MVVAHVRAIQEGHNGIPGLFVFMLYISVFSSQRSSDRNSEVGKQLTLQKF
jgi:hypothetical protein